MKAQILNAFFPILLLSAMAQAQDATENDNTNVEANLPYELIITPTVTRGRLRSLIVEVEDDFWEKFNELNIDKEYDVRCYKFTPTMSHIKRRICEPKFYANARGANAHETSFLLGSISASAANSATSSAWLFSPIELHNETSPKFKILSEKLEEFTRTESEFRIIGNVWADLLTRLENYGKN